MIRFITFIIWMVINSTKPSAIQADTLHISAQQTYTAGIDTLTQEAITQLDTLYKLKAKEIVMQRHRTLIKRMAITICIMTSVILSSSLLLWVGWRHLRTHKNKLQPTNANFDDLPCNNRQLKPSEEITIDEIPEPTELFTESSETDTYLFKRIERCSDAVTKHSPAGTTGQSTGATHSYAYQFGRGLDTLTETSPYPDDLRYDRRDRLRFRLISIQPNAIKKK